MKTKKVRPCNKKNKVKKRECSLGELAGEKKNGSSVVSQALLRGVASSTKLDYVFVATPCITLDCFTFYIYIYAP